MPQRPAIAAPPPAPAPAAAPPAAAAAAAVSLACAGWLGVSPLAAPLAAAGLVGTLGLIVGPHLGEHPHRRLGPANALTLARAALVGVLAGAIGARPEAGDALALAAAAALAMDVADGAVARRSGLASGFGARLDMELDALTVLVLGALYWQLGKAGAWVLLSGALRYLFVAASWRAPWMAAPLYPSAARKLTCGVQVAVLAVGLSTQIPASVSARAAALALALLCWSFGRDTLWLWRQR